MDNRTIILQERLNLRNQGVIGDIPGHTITILDDNGCDKVIPEPQMIYSIPALNRAGMKVKAGAHPVTRLEIWIPKKDKSGSDSESEADSKQTIEKTEFVKKMTNFFTLDQAEKR